MELWFLIMGYVVETYTYEDDEIETLYYSGTYN